MCSKGCAKCILVFFNAIFFVVGGVMLGLGIYILVDKETVTKIIGYLPGEIGNLIEGFNLIDLVQSASYALIATGGVIFIIAFMGCCGALQESKCFLTLYSIIVILVIGAEVAGGVFLYLYKDDVETYLKDRLMETIDKYDGVSVDEDGKIVMPKDALSLGWDLSQVIFKCCGSTNYTDYETSENLYLNYTLKNSHGNQTHTFKALVPPTCCKMDNPADFPGAVEKITFMDLEQCLTTAHSNSTNHIGCVDSIKNEITMYSFIVIGVLGGIVLIELLLLICALCLCRSIDQEK